MPKSKKTTKIKHAPKQRESIFFLKIVMYLVIGTQWLWIQTANGQVPIPVGAITGVIFAMHDHFQIDRKIEYALLIVAMLIGFVASMGIVVRI